MPTTARCTKSLIDVLSEAKHQARAEYNMLGKTVQSNWYARLSERVAFAASPLDKKAPTQLGYMSN